MKLMARTYRAPVAGTERRSRILRGMPGSVVRSLRTVRTRRLLATCGAVLAAGGSVTAIALAAGSSGDVPPAKGLATAVHDALTAPDVQGITARIKFTNKLIDSSAVQGASPLLSGASGRLWVGAGDHFRLELQSDRGDAQIVSDGTTLTVYDATSNTGYRAKLPQHRAKRAADRHKVPTIAEIQQSLDRLVKHLSVSGAVPSNVAGEPAYTVRLAPKRNGGLLGRAELAWDAARGVPLRAAVYAVGNDAPVLELRATRIAFGAVPESTFAITAPADAKITEIRQGRARSNARRAPAREAKPVTGAAAVAAALPFALSAPDTLARMQRGVVRLLDFGGSPAALVTYGEGLGGLAVIERAAGAEKAQATRSGHGAGLELPTIDVPGAQAQVLPTALGTAVTFTRAGVRYAVVGSVGQPVAEAAARGL